MCGRAHRDRADSSVQRDRAWAGLWGYCRRCKFQWFVFSKTKMLVLVGRRNLGEGSACSGLLKAWAYRTRAAVTYEEVVKPCGLIVIPGCLAAQRAREGKRGVRRLLTGRCSRCWGSHADPWTHGKTNLRRSNEDAALTSALQRNKS